MNSHYFVMNGILHIKKKTILRLSLFNSFLSKAHLFQSIIQVDSLQPHFFQTIRQATEVRDRQGFPANGRLDIS